MFQTFDVSSTPEQGNARLEALREELRDLGVDGFLVPRADVHQGEYVAPRDARLEWLTGFTGSAGFCVVLPDIAGVFIDGRYRVQVRSQVAEVFTPVPWPETTLADWLKEHLPQGGTIGYDNALHTVKEIENLQSELAGTKIKLHTPANPIDAIWTDQPAPPTAPFIVHPLEYAGEDHASKRARVAKTLKAPACFISSPDSIAWLLNIRGADIERNPVPHAFLVLNASGKAILYCDPAKTRDLGDHLGGDVEVREVKRLTMDIATRMEPMQIDPATCPDHAKFLIEPREIVRAPDPCSLPKACKNATEIAGARAAHLRDGAAMANFLAWLDAQAPKGTLTEIDVVTALEEFRRNTNALRDISFETIAGAGPNGAIVHYRVNTKTNRTVNPGELLLVDSGGQYVDGTTDITRTISIGAPTQEHCDCYTQVLRGMIAVSMARFPKGVGGQHLDALARTPLWQAGRDYDHGTGHGVGSYLSVHEGPQGISRRSTVALAPGMILSNEPGYYREGAFGIRIENLIVVTPADHLPDGDDREMYSFETLTFVPFDRRLINISDLTPAERVWIDRYHADTLRFLSDRVEADTKLWLTAACAPL